MCHTCHVLQPLSSFSYDERRHKHFGRCRSCTNAAQAQRNALYRTTGTGPRITRVCGCYHFGNIECTFVYPQGRAAPDTLPLPTAEKPTPYKYTCSGEVQLHRYRWRPSYGAERSPGINYDSALLAGLAGEAAHRNRRGQFNRAWEGAGVPEDAWGPGDAVDVQRALEGMANHPVGRAHIEVHEEQMEARRRHLNRNR